MLIILKLNYLNGRSPQSITLSPSSLTFSHFGGGSDGEVKLFGSAGRVDLVFGVDNDEIREGGRRLRQSQDLHGAVVCVGHE